MHHPLRYRPHIDGLRAIAVLGVVLFHFGAGWLPGGFVGVDVFFVISGFLISRSIYADMADGRFEILGFYERRIRRIAPAFLVVTAVTAIFAWLILLPHEMMIFGRSVLWSVFAAGNIFFFNRTDYFGPAAQEMPLLHYWSLAVEEQFYLLFPALMLICWRFRARIVPWMVVALFVASLAASEFMISYQREAAYFLLPYRAFELLLGSLLALPGMWFPKGARARAAAVIAGCALILASMLVITSASPFPGLVALVPCLGAALVIWGGENGPTLPSRLLGGGVMIFFGKISYSLYLVHWPIASLAREWLGEVDPFAFLIGGVGASILLGYLSYRFVEQPVRINRTLFAPKRLLGGMVAATLALAAFGQYAIATRGIPERFSPEIRQLASYAFYDTDPIFRTHLCFTPFFQSTPDIKPECLPATKPSVMVWGNSHIAHFIGAIAEEAKRRGYAVGQITGAACPPVGEGPSGRLPFCDEMNRLARNWILRNRPDILVLGGIDAMTPALDRQIAAFARAGIRVVVVGPVPMYTMAVPKLLARRLAAGNRDVRGGGEMLPTVLPIDRALKAHFAPKPNVTYISPLDAACGGADCPLAVAGEPLQNDSSHFTKAGVDYFGRPVARLIFGEAQGAEAGAGQSPAVSSTP